MITPYSTDIIISTTEIEVTAVCNK